MADDAKILLDTSLRSKNITLAVHLLLENVKHSQTLQDKFAACEWITASNKLLNLRKDRWIGICLLGCLVDQCQTELFNENCLTWLRILVQILQQENHNTMMCKHVTEVLGKILSFSVQFSEISREISLTIIPSLFTAVLNEKNTNPEISLLVARTCIEFYPSASGSFVKRVESLILHVFDTDNYFLIEIACSCFAILPKCGSSSGSEKQTSFWEIQWKKVLNSLSTVVKEFYDKNISKAGSDELHLKTIPVVEPQRTETCVLRIKFLFKCLDLMLNNEFSKTVNIPLDSTIAIIYTILAVNEKPFENKVGLESILLKSSICALHLSAIKFLSSLILRCGMNLLFCSKITPMIVRELSWNKCNEKICGFQQKYSELRSAVYDCVQYMVHVNSSLGESSEAMKTIIRHIIEDIKPRVTTTKLLAPTASTSKTPSHGKKAKRKRIQDDVNQLNRTEQKTDNHANKNLCLSGLKALNTVILNGGNDISDALKEVQVFVVTLLLKCQQISTCQSNYPIPYGSPDCRKMLYNLLQTLLYHNVPECPPPLQHAVSIFGQGTQDQDLEVSKFCTEAQMMCQVLIHPRVPIISCSNLLQEQEIVNVQNNVAYNTHVNSLQKEVEKNDDCDDEPLGDSETIRDYPHTTSPILNNEQSSSSVGLPTKDRNISDVSKETQRDTSEQKESEIKESRQRNEEVHKDQDFSEYEDNIKRVLPKEFEEGNTDEVLSVGVSDSILPEKRRKTEDGRTSYSGGNVLNNNDSIAESTKIVEQNFESGEDETLAMEMISSFVDSVPD